MVDTQRTLPFSSIVAITGTMAAGKSTVAQHLAERGTRSVHLRGDIFRRMIVRGQAAMGFDLSSEAAAQLDLRYRLAATTAHMYVESGWTVVYQDIIIGADFPATVRRLYRVDVPLYVVVLNPDAATVAQRERDRPKTGYGSLSVADFVRVVETETPRIGLWVDSSVFSVEQTVDYILSHLDEARVRFDD